MLNTHFCTDRDCGRRTNDQLIHHNPFRLAKNATFLGSNDNCKGYYGYDLLPTPNKIWVWFKQKGTHSIDIWRAERGPWNVLVLVCGSG